MGKRMKSSDEESEEQDADGNEGVRPDVAAPGQAVGQDQQANAEGQRGARAQRRRA